MHVPGCVELILVYTAFWYVHIYIYLYQAENEEQAKIPFDQRITGMSTCYIFLYAVVYVYILLFMSTCWERSLGSCVALSLCM